MIRSTMNSQLAWLFRLAIVPSIAFALVSCTSDTMKQGIRPSAVIGEKPAPAQNLEQQKLAATSPLLPIDAPVAPATPNATPSPGVIFLPVLGPPQSAVNRLSGAVKRSAQNHAITIIPNGQPGAVYQVKGYFSALDDGTGTRLIFIWDVLDNTGNNIHRISGEKRTQSRKSDPWAAIDTNLIDGMVESTLQKLRQWINTRA